MAEDYRILPKRRADTHKGDYGRLLIIGGSVGYTGAPTLCARAAVRAGAGLVSLGVPERIYDVTAVKNDEAMPFPLPDKNGLLSQDALPAILERLRRSDVCVLGPGLGRSEELTRLVFAVVAESGIPLVLDADAINALSLDVSALDRAHAPIFLTPHDGEFRRLCDDGGDRADETSAFAQQHGVTVVRKGHETVVAHPDGKRTVLRAGNPGMAKGGSGDVLAGVLGAFLCQLPRETAAEAAVFAHGLAGDLCAERLGEYGMTPSDLIRALPEATKRMVSD